MKIFLVSQLMLLSLFFPGCIFDDTEEKINDLQNENTMLKKDAVYSLGECGEEDAVPHLMRLVQHDRSPEIRAAAIEALGKIGDTSSVDVLIDVLHENDTTIVRFAAEALGKIEDPKAVNPLIHLLKNNDFKHNDAQITAIWAIGNIADQGGVLALAGLLESSNKYIQYNAMQALKKIGDTE